MQSIYSYGRQTLGLSHKQADTLRRAVEHLGYSRFPNKWLPVYRELVARRVI